MSPLPEPQSGDLSGWRPRSALLGSLLANRYRITSFIGQGSTGAVFRADDVISNKPVAVRILVPALAHEPALISRIRARIDRNAEIARRDPSALVNLVDILDVGMTLESELFVVTDFIDGDHLTTMLLRGGRLPWSRARSLLIRLCQIVQGLHEQGIVLGTLQARQCYAVRGKSKHEAIKIVNNAIFDQLAAVIGPTAGHGAAVLARYIAPEQACGEPVDARTDVYSFGVIAYELLTGSVPFAHANTVRLVAMHLQRPPRPPRELAPDAAIPADVEEALLRSLEKAPEDRFQTMEAFAAALTAVPESSFTAAAHASASASAAASEIPLHAMSPGAAAATLAITNATSPPAPHASDPDPGAAAAILAITNATSPPTHDNLGAADTLLGARTHVDTPPEPASTSASPDVRAAADELSAASSTRVADPASVARVADEPTTAAPPAMPVSASPLPSDAIAPAHSPAGSASTGPLAAASDAAGTAPLAPASPPPATSQTSAPAATAAPPVLGAPTLRPPTLAPSIGGLRLPPPPTLGRPATLAPGGLNLPPPPQLGAPSATTRPPSAALPSAIGRPPSLATPAAVPPTPSATLPAGSIARPAAAPATQTTDTPHPAAAPASPSAAAPVTPVPAASSPVLSTSSGTPVPSASTPAPSASPDAPVPPASAPVSSASPPPPAASRPHVHATLIPGSASALAAEHANASAAVEAPRDDEPRASTSGARRQVIRLTEVRGKAEGDSASSSGAFLRVALADAAESARPGPQPRPAEPQPRPAEPRPQPAELSDRPAPRPEPRPIVSGDALRSAALQQSALTAAPPALSAIHGPTDSIVAELPPRRTGWVLGAVGLLAAAGIAALVLSSPSFTGRSDPTPAKQGVATRTPDPGTRVADVTPRPRPVEDPRIDPPRGDGVVPPPVVAEPPTPPEEPVVPPPGDTVEPKAVEPEPEPDPDLRAKPGKKDPATKKKPRRNRDVPEEEPEKDVFDQLREHMAKKKADEEARKASLQNPTPAPTPAPAPARTEPQTDAERARETLDRARTAASGGNPQLGYTLAKQSFNLAKTQESLELMGSCACRLKNENNARSALNALSGSRRDTVIAACTKVGINL